MPPLRGCDSAHGAEGVSRRRSPSSALLRRLAGTFALQCLAPAARGAPGGTSVCSSGRRFTPPLGSLSGSGSDSAKAEQGFHTHHCDHWVVAIATRDSRHATCGDSDAGALQKSLRLRVSALKKRPTFNAQLPAGGDARVMRGRHCGTPSATFFCMTFCYLDCIGRVLRQPTNRGTRC